MSHNVKTLRNNDNLTPHDPFLLNIHIHLLQTVYRYPIRYKVNLELAKQQIKGNGKAFSKPILRRLKTVEKMIVLRWKSGF